MKEEVVRQMEDELDILRKDYSDKERQDIPLEDFGDPSRRAFPIVVAADVIHAAQRLGEASGSKAAIKKRIIAIAKRKGFSLPQTWQEQKERGVSVDDVDDVVVEGANTPLSQKLYIPIVRFDEKDWTVTGQATVEDIDAYGTVFDYEASKRAFQSWRGNVREMHDSKKAVGRGIEVSYDDANKAIFVTTRVSHGAKDTWEKIVDGTLTGYSVGALAAKDDWSTIERNGKSIPLLKNYKLIELSLVDHPATPGCNIEIVRADGFANGEYLAEDEPEQVQATVESTEQRAGSALSKANRDKLHAVRDNALQMCADNGCDECSSMMSSKKDDGDGDEDSSERLIEAAILRALAPTIQRVNALSARLAAQKPIEIPAPQPVVNVDTSAIERRLEAIEQTSTVVTEVQALTRALDAKLSEVKELAERIAQQPVGGGPYANSAAMDKVLATGASPSNNNQNVLAQLARMAQSSNLTEEQRLAIASQQIKLERGW